MTPWAAYAVGPTTLARGPFDRPAVDTVHVQGRDFWQVGDNGWFMLLCWSAGAAHVLRTPDPMSGHTVRTVCVTPGRPEPTVRLDPRSEADQDDIEDCVNTFLADAGVPPRPRGFAWHLHVPPGATPSAIVAAIDASEAAHGHPSPVDIARFMNTALAGVYGWDAAGPWG